ncbi:unnamed protein product, partial [marine sediment metagenome]
MLQTTPDSESRICTKCGNTKSLAQFRRRHAGTEIRHAHCNECRNILSRVATAKKRFRDTRGFVSAANRARDVQQVSSLLSAILPRFGGMVGLANEMARWYKESAPGSIIRGRLINLPIHLMILLEPERQA